MINIENQFPDEIEELDEKESNSSLKGFSIDEKYQKESTKTKSEKEKSSHNFLNKSFEAKINFFKRFFLKNDLKNLFDLSNKEIHHKKRSKTFFKKAPKISEKKAPKHKSIINNEYMSPFTLNSNKENKNYRINNIDSKSMDDINELYEYNGSDDENFEKIKIFEGGFCKYLRKKMTEFRLSYNFIKRNEYENILNIENIFYKNDIMILKPNSRKNVRKKKCNYWHKHILEQNRRLSLNVYLNKDNVFGLKKHNKAGLFILGVLECAALDKKRRKSAVNVKIEIVDNNNNI